MLEICVQQSGGICGDGQSGRPQAGGQGIPRGSPTSADMSGRPALLRCRLVPGRAGSVAPASELRAEGTTAQWAGGW